MKAISFITYGISQAFDDALKNHSIGISDNPDLIKKEKPTETKCKHWKVDTLIDAYSIERYFIEEFGMKRDGEMINNFEKDFYVYIY